MAVPSGPSRQSRPKWNGLAVVADGERFPRSQTRFVLRVSSRAAKLRPRPNVEVLPGIRDCLRIRVPRLGRCNVAVGMAHDARVESCEGWSEV